MIEIQLTPVEVNKLLNLVGRVLVPARDPAEKALLDGLYVKLFDKLGKFAPEGRR